MPYDTFTERERERGGGGVDRRPFYHISIISGRLEGDKATPCAIEYVLYKGYPLFGGKEYTKDLKTAECTSFLDQTS